jgi:hypothetical protein
LWSNRERHSDLALALKQDTPSDVLSRLTRSRSVSVRRLVAQHRNLAAVDQLVLLEDKEREVRFRLLEHGKLAPEVLDALAQSLVPAALAEPASVPLVDLLDEDEWPLVMRMWMVSRLACHPSTPQPVFDHLDVGAVFQVAPDRLCREGWDEETCAVAVGLADGFDGTVGQLRALAVDVAAHVNR